MPHSDTQLKGFCVRQVIPNDLPAVAALHRAVFPGQLLTQLGPHLIQRFYAQFITHPNNYMLVAWLNDSVVGFVAGTTNKNELFRRFYRAHLGRITVAVITRPAIWSALRKGAGVWKPHVKRLTHALLGSRIKRSALSQSVPDSRIPNRLMSIGVDEACRGKGIAECLVDEFCDRLKQVGIKEVGLSVLAHNVGAIRFYEKTGWLRERETDTAIYFYRPTASINK